MTRLAAPAAVASALLVVMSAGCGASREPAKDAAGGEPASTAPQSAPHSAPQTSADAAATKLAPSLAARLSQLPLDEPIRLIAMVQPGSATAQLRRQVEGLGGRLLQRFTLIEAIVVVVPRKGVLPLAALPQVRGLELADTAAPPPNHA
jgi:hypothetical protein